MRHPLRLSSICVLMTCLSAHAAEAPPRDNPIEAFYARDAQAVPKWISKLPWDRVRSIAESTGANDDARLAAAQSALGGKGGVIYFPPGVYSFKEHINLQDGVILRGHSPSLSNAKDEKYALATRFELPKYNYSPQGNGTPIDTAFKSIRVSRLPVLRTAPNCRGNQQL